MKPRLLLYILLALAGAVCLYSGLKFHRHMVDDETVHKESLTVGLAGSPLHTRTKSVTQAGSTDTTTPGEPIPGSISVSEATTVVSSWHPISASALLAVVGLVLLLAAGRLRKVG